MKLPTVVASPDGPTTVPSGAAVLARLLVEFEELVTALGSPISDWLNPPVDPVEVTQKLAAYDLVANEEVLEWFGWHNGLRDRSQSAALTFPLLPGFGPASIDEALRTYRMTVVDFAVPMADDARYYSRGVGHGWLLLSLDAFGFAVDCTGEFSQPPLVRKPMDEYIDEGFAGKLQAVSLCTLVTWWIEALNSGATRWDAGSQQWSELDLTLVSDIRRDAFFV